jgi:hypothetical protein
MALYSTGFVEGFNRGVNSLLIEHVDPPKLRPIPPSFMEETKSAIKAYFDRRHGEVIDYADLVEEFGWPLPLIVDACEELEREGKIVGVD